MKHKCAVLILVVGLLALSGCSTSVDVLPTPEKIAIIATPKWGEIYYEGKLLLKAKYQYNSPVFEEPLILVDNLFARNVSFQEVTAFLSQTRPQRDAMAQNLDSRFFAGETYLTCGYYIQEVHNDAESAGIRSGVAILEMVDNDFHGINVFETIDNGLVYVDCSYYSDLIVRPSVGQNYEVYGNFLVIKEITLIWEGYKGVIEP